MILGIDPGTHGGMAIINTQGKLLDSWCFNKLSEQEIYKALEPYELIESAYLEKVGSRPGQGVKSMFTFGQTVGFIKGCLVCLKIPTQYVTPNTWMKAVGCPSGLEKTARKNWLKQKAQELYPRHHIILDNADAIMLAYYGYKNYLKYYRPEYDL